MFVGKNLNIYRTAFYIKVIATASSNEERGILENLDTPIGKIGSLGIKKDKRIFMLSQTQSN